MRWITCELHTHTQHSDGIYTLRELAVRASELGLDAIALTDHSTAAGLHEITDDLPVGVIRGMEWTTYFGHVVILGMKEFVDWRNATPTNIDCKLREVARSGGIAGIAHPFSVDAPVCNGCHWSFDVRDWSLPTYIEVWSAAYPPLINGNKRAYQKWTDLLDAGYHMTAVSARDWHGAESNSIPFGVTCLQIDEQEPDITRAAMDALKQHRAYLTLGPAVTFCARQGDLVKSIGETCRKGIAELSVTFDTNERRPVWDRFDMTFESVSFVGCGNQTIAHLDFLGFGQVHTVKLKNCSGWIIARLEGRLNGQPCPVAFTNPVFFED